jgi:O-antigen/teichoic acid export membrane protein
VGGSVLIIALGQAVLPRLAKQYYCREMQAFKIVIIKMAFVGFVLALTGVGLAVGAGEAFLHIAYTAEYSKYDLEFILIMIAGGIGYFGYILGFALTAARSFKIQAISYAINLMATLIASFLLIPKLGLVGGAYAMIIGFVSQIIIESIKLYLIIQKRERHPDICATN